MKLYCKWLDNNKYSEAGINKDGNIYIIQEIKVQRGMGHEKANELLIIGINKNQIEKWCERNNCQIVGRDTEVAREDILVLESGKETKDEL